MLPDKKIPATFQPIVDNRFQNVNKYLRGCNFIRVSSRNIAQRQNLCSMPQRIVFIKHYETQRLENTMRLPYISRWIIKHAFA